MAAVWASKVKLAPALESIPYYLLRPVRLIQGYDRRNLRPDLLAGLTVAVVVLPQAIAFALIAELPPQMGLYAAVVGALVGGLWGSSNQTHTGPTNAISALVLSALLSTTVPGGGEFIVAAGLLAVMAGVLQLVMGLARLGLLINFVSHSVIVGFAAGAGVLIAIGQLRHLFGLTFPSRTVLETLSGLAVNLTHIDLITAALGLGTIGLIVLVRKSKPKLPAPLLAMVAGSLLVLLFSLDERGVAVIGSLPAGLPPLANVRLFDLDLLGRLSTGALAIGAISLVQTTAVARSIASQTRQPLDSNQEFVGQGLANIAAGLFSGYPCSGSFSNSAVNYKAGARTPMAAIFSSLFVVVALFTVGPLAAYLPRAAVSGALVVTAYTMIDWQEIRRIWRGAPGDAAIMVVTLLGTVFLKIEFAVLAGFLLSFALYIVRTSTPRVIAVLPDDDFRHFLPQPEKRPCPQLAIIELWGDLYFGAVHHVEKAIQRQAALFPEQRFLLLRLHHVNQCDFSGIHTLEHMVASYRERGGDVFMVRVHEPVLALMQATGFYDYLGADHFLDEDLAISQLFYHVIDPAVCIYECPIRAFKECQNLPKREIPAEVLFHTEIVPNGLVQVTAGDLWGQLRNGQARPLVVDVREPREFHRGHIPQAELLPLPELLASAGDLPRDRPVVLVCRSGRRSQRAAYSLQKKGFANVTTLQGGMLAWESAGLLEAVD